VLGDRQAAAAALSAAQQPVPPPQWPWVVDAGSSVRLEPGGRLSGHVDQASGAPDDAPMIILVDGDDGCAAAALLDTPAPTLGRALERTGLRGRKTSRLVLRDVVATAIYDEAAATAARRHRRLVYAACGIGVGRNAVAAAAAYLQERRQFGHPLSEFGALRRMLADAASRVAAAATLLHAATSQRRPEPALELQASRAATHAAVRAADDALQLHGGYGYITEYVPERLLRDAITLRALAGGRKEAREVGALLGDPA
jgi:alkylation response protein AidB-like acyl-CoA dehydrogenase